MGRLHARCYSQLPGVRLAGVYDASREIAQSVARDFGTVACDSLEALAATVRAATIAVPTTQHVDVAGVFLRAGVGCLVEKPIAENSTQARRIVDLARSNNVPLMVGHIERFNPAVRALRELNIKPQFIEVNRISPFTFRSVDVGVVLDMMIHDLDIILQLARSPVVSVDSVGVNVLAECEDICNARLRFANGCVANVTASRIALKTERRLRVFSNEAYVSLDYQKKYGIFVRRSGNVDSLRELVKRIRAGEVEDLAQMNYTDLVDVQELQIDDVEPIRAELSSFIQSVRDGKPVEVSGEDGVAAVELAERIVASMPRHAV
jgi:predicted dehydrogenase